MELTPADKTKQELYRDARFTKKYDDIWQSVGKCVFCDLNEKYIFFEENGIVMTISLYAYIDGHFMILPRRHVRSTKDLNQLEWETIRKFSYIAKKLIKDVHGIKGTQLILRDGGIVAQSTVSDHLHIHCIPFDAPDLNQWNYRKLKYTPLENVNLYKQQRRKIIKLDIKYEEKYKNPSGLRIVCDLVILNRKNEVLLVERSEENKFMPDTLCLPGGHVDNFDKTLEAELVREIQEETGIRLDTKKISLLSSSISSVKYTFRSKPLKTRFALPSRFLWNVYIIKGFKKSSTLIPGSDSKTLHWVGLSKAIDLANVSPGIRNVLKNVKV